MTVTTGAGTSTEARAGEPDNRAPALVFDVDSHVSEAPDIWTSRLSAKWGDLAPRLEFDPESGRDRWRVGNHLLTSVAKHAVAGWREPYPSSPPTIEEAHPAAFDAKARLEYMDGEGIEAQVVYPNVLGFQVWAFLKLELALRNDCVRAFNDWQVEYCSADPDRLIPLMFLPFWDIEAATAELTRCTELGYRGINMGWQPERLGFPRLRDQHWDPLLARAQESGLSINFHIGFSDKTEEEMTRTLSLTDMCDMARDTTLLLMGNASCIAELIMGRICHRFPSLNFVSIESGYGYIPYLLDALEWQFCNMGAAVQNRDMLLPTEYFRRQIYTTFWFEHHVDRMIDLYPDNVMFETDFPHATSLAPQEGSIAENAQATIRKNLASLPVDALEKVLRGNARRLYGPRA